jgi:hypothetical protein
MPGGSFADLVGGRLGAAALLPGGSVGFLPDGFDVDLSFLSILY